MLKRLWKTPNLTGDITKVDRRTQYEPVGPGNLFQNGCQRVLELADVGRLALDLAGHAGHAALAALVVQIIKTVSLHFVVGIHRLGPLGEFLEHLCRIHVAARAAVDDYNLLHILNLGCKSTKNIIEKHG